MSSVPLCVWSWIFLLDFVIGLIVGDFGLALVVVSPMGSNCVASKFWFGDWDWLVTLLESWLLHSFDELPLMVSCIWGRFQYVSMLTLLSSSEAFLGVFRWSFDVLFDAFPSACELTLQTVQSSSECLKIVSILDTKQAETNHSPTIASAYLLILKFLFEDVSNDRPIDLCRVCTKLPSAVSFLSTSTSSWCVHHHSGIIDCVKIRELHHQRKFGRYFRVTKSWGEVRLERGRK